MHRTRLLPVSFLLTLALLGGLHPGLSVLAQDITAPVAESEFPFIPDPSECTIEPRNMDHLLDLWFSGELDSSMVYASARCEIYAEFLPVGLPADNATTEAVIQVVEAYFSCRAANDFPRALAYFTDDMVRAFGPDPFRSREEVLAWIEANPVPEPAAEPGRILAITNVMSLSDGRIGAFVINDGEVQAFTVYVVFELQADGRLLIDEVHQFA